LEPTGEPAEAELGAFALVADAEFEREVAAFLALPAPVADTADLGLALLVAISSHLIRFNDSIMRCH
jgi:hypothetical protein